MAKHTVVVTINGTDITSLLLRESLFIRHSIGNADSVADLTIKDDGTTYFPQGWDEIIITVDGTAIFGGYVFQYDGEVIGTGNKETHWHLQCKDWSLLLDRVRINSYFREMDDSEIIDNIFITYFAGDGFDSTTNVDTVAADQDIGFTNVTAREALNTLAARGNAKWFIKPDKSISWHADSGFPAADFNINTVNPNGTTSRDVAFNSIRRQVDESTIVNRITVIGGLQASGIKANETFSADGITDTFGVLAQVPSSIWSVEYFINGGQYVRYTTNIGYEPDDRLIVDGGTYEVLCNLENHTVRIRHHNGDIPDNGTDVIVNYYYMVPVEVTVDHTGSQNFYGRVFSTTVQNEELTNYDSAVSFGETFLEKNAFGRQTVTFDTYEYGLEPGKRISVTAPTLGLGEVVTAADLILEYDLTDGALGTRSRVLAEDNGTVLLQSYASTINYVVQEVAYRPVLSGTQHLLVARVSIGDWEHTLIDALQNMGNSTSGNGSLSGQSGSTRARRLSGRLSNLSNDLGEVAAGRALFTDGGSGQFSWDNYAEHTGAIVGLEEKDGQSAYGAVYILDGGTIKAKMGRMTGLPNVGTVTPSGWGIWTTNGYFQGVVAASTLIGGTISGGLISGGTVSGGLVSGGTVSGALVSGGTVSGALLTGGTLIASIGTIGGFTIGSNKLYSSGGTIATGSIVNSSNPGVYLNSSGLFGYGTLGLTFKIPTDPAQAPWFSSGTINNVVYEVYETAVMRTSSNVFNDGGIQIDNSGIYAVNPITGAVGILLENGVDFLTTENGGPIYANGLTFAVDATTGRMWAEEGTFSGTISASQIIGGTITGIQFEGQGITGGTVTGSQIVGGTITSASVSASNISGGTILGGIITASTQTNGNFSDGTITAGYFTSGTIQGGTIIASTFTGGAFSGNSFTGSNIVGGTITGMLIQAGTLTGHQITAGTIASTRLTSGTIQGLVITANQISGGTVSGALVSGGTVSGGFISGGTVSGGLISGGTISSPGLISAYGGSITMGASYYGMDVTTNTSGVYSGISWRRGGTIAAAVQATQLSSGSAMYTQLLAKSISTSNATVELLASNFSSTFLTAVTLDNSSIWLYFSGATGTAQFQLKAAGGQFIGSALYPNSNNIYDLGKSSTAWRYLYLASPDNTIWRLSVSNAGALVIT